MPMPLCFQIAEEGLQRYPASGNEAERVGAASLWVRKHDALIRLGRIEEAESALEVAFGLVSAGTSQEASFLLAAIQMLQGRLLQQEGRIPEAIDKFEAARHGFEQGGHPRERAVVLGDVARLRARSGDLSGALKLHEEKLQICRQLGDISEVANAQYYLAELDHEQGNTSRSLDRLAEAWEINLQIGRADGIAFVGQFYGQLLASIDRPRALEILRTSRGAFELLGMTSEVAEMDEVIRRIENPEPPAVQPRPTFWQRLKRLLGL